MGQWERKPEFLVAGSGASGSGNTAGLETSATFFGSGFTSKELGFFVQSSYANTGATITAPENPFFAAIKTADATSSGTFSKRSTPIFANTITRIERKVYHAPVAEIWTVGFDGVTVDTTKGLVFNCDADYGIKLIAYSAYIRKFYNNQGFVQPYVIHTSCCDDCAGCSSALCYAEAAKFVNIINSTPQAGLLTRFVYSEILLDGFASDTVAVWTDASTMSLTYGSATVTTSAANTLAAGNYIRIGDGTSGQNPPTNIMPVYKVKSVESSTSFTLDTPWQQASATRTLDTTLADSDVTLVTLSAVTVCGLKFTGRFLTVDTGCCCFPPFPWDFEGVTFFVTNDDLNSFPCGFNSAQNTALVYGNGGYKEMQYIEMDAAGYTDTRQWFLDCAANKYITNLVSTDTYDTYYIEFDQIYPTTEMGGNMNRTRKLLILAVTNTTPGTAGSTTATAVDTFMTSLGTLAGITVMNN